VGVGGLLTTRLLSAWLLTTRLLSARIIVTWIIAAGIISDVFLRIVFAGGKRKDKH
jgi:hypothetical protein